MGFKPWNDNKQFVLENMTSLSRSMCERVCVCECVWLMYMCVCVCQCERAVVSE